jgi:hypothetical protein
LWTKIKMMTLGIADAFLKKAYGVLMPQLCWILDNINININYNYNYNKVDLWTTSTLEDQAFQSDS